MILWMIGKIPSSSNLEKITGHSRTRAKKCLSYLCCKISELFVNLWKHFAQSLLQKNNRAFRSLSPEMYARSTTVTVGVTAE